MTLENMVVNDNATIGIFFWGDGDTFRNLTVSNNGLLGIGGNKAPELRPDELAGGEQQHRAASSASRSPEASS